MNLIFLRWQHFDERSIHAPANIWYTDLLLHAPDESSENQVVKCFQWLLFHFPLATSKNWTVIQHIGFGIFIIDNFIHLWCGVAQLAACRLAVRQARVWFSARHHREVVPTEHTSDEDMERGFSEWRRMNVLWLNECMYVIKSKINTKRVASCHQTFKFNFIHSSSFYYLKKVCFSVVLYLQTTVYNTLYLQLD